MRTLPIRTLIPMILLACMLVGCADKPILERGWIGGRFAEVSDTAVDARKWDEPVLVRQVFVGTPAAEAGLLTGDVILSVGGETLDDGVSSLRETIEQAKPGTTLKLGIDRMGKAHELEVTIGEERYLRGGFFALGLSLSLRAKLIPTPDFNWFGLVRFSYKADERLELHAARQRLHDSVEQRGDETGLRSPEGWKFWLGVIGFGAHKEIVSQKSVK